MAEKLDHFDRLQGVLWSASLLDLTIKMRRRHELTDEQWKKIRSLLPRRFGRPPVRSDRNFINGVLWIAKTGVPWRDLPRRYGNWKTVYNRFRNWARRDVWRDIFRAAVVSDDEVGGILDGSVVRAHQDAAGGKGGPKKTTSGDRAEASPASSTRPLTRRANRSRS